MAGLLSSHPSPWTRPSPPPTASLPSPVAKYIRIWWAAQGRRDAPWGCKIFPFIKPGTEVQPERRKVVGRSLWTDHRFPCRHRGNLLEGSATEGDPPASEEGPPCWQGPWAPCCSLPRAHGYLQGSASLPFLEPGKKLLRRFLMICQVNQVSSPPFSNFTG